MQSDSVQRVRIYLSEKDTISGRPSYLATLETLREAGATGATALRGLAGFGVSQRLATESGDPNQKLPVVIEWIDRADRVGRILPSLDALLPDALITIEQVQIYRATLRSSGPFGERRVGDLAARDVATIASHRSVADAIRLMLGSHSALPITDDQQRLVGTFSRADMRRHAQLAPELLAALPEAERAALLAPLEAAPLAQAIRSEVLALSVDSSVLQATKAMIEWGLDEVPVTNREGRFHGIFTTGHALQAAQESRAASDGPIRDAERPSPIGLLMQGVRRSVLGYALAAEGIERLAEAGEVPLVVLDSSRPLGVLDIGALLAGAEPPLRDALVVFFRSGPPSPALAELLGETRVASLPLAPLPTLPTTAGYDQAIALLHEQGSAWLAAVDDQGRAQGLIGQRTILRALVQESGA